jgi:hypothetical protein
MCDDKVSSLQKTVQSVATKVPKIVIQRAEEIFPALKEIMVSLMRFRPQKIILRSFCLILHLQ